MVDAFTIQRGNESRTFKSRQELYDYMVENGEVILEGDDAPVFKAHVDKRAAKADHKVNAAAQRMKTRLESE